jgi:parvulin-like peptidyl-prolyl isomerase
LKQDDLTAKIGTEGLAEEILQKLEDGEPFEKLAQEYSDDAKKGELSAWIERGSQGEDFDEIFFAEDVQLGARELISTPTEIRIVELMEQEAEGLQPLDSVRDDIIEAIQKREAPIYAAEKARELFEKWQIQIKHLKRSPTSTPYPS